MAWHAILLQRRLFLLPLLLFDLLETGCHVLGTEALALLFVVAVVFAPDSLLVFFLGLASLTNLILILLSATQPIYQLRLGANPA